MSGGGGGSSGKPRIEGGERRKKETAAAAANVCVKRKKEILLDIQSYFVLVQIFLLNHQTEVSQACLRFGPTDTEHTSSFMWFPSVRTEAFKRGMGERNSEEALLSLMARGFVLSRVWQRKRKED